jgi:hypothetical protein
LIRDSASVAGSLIVLLSDAGLGFTLDARASLDPTWLGVVCPTEAKVRMEERNAGRAVAKRREVERSEAIMGCVADSVFKCTMQLNLLEVVYPASRGRAVDPLQGQG